MNTQIFSDIPMFDGTVHFGSDGILHHPTGWLVFRSEVYRALRVFLSGWNGE